MFSGDSAKTLQKFFTDNNVVALKADWTNKDPAITKVLREEFNRSSIPVNAVYPSSIDQPAILLPTFPLKQEHVIQGVEKAK